MCAKIKTTRTLNVQCSNTLIDWAVLCFDHARIFSQLQWVVFTRRDLHVWLCQPRQIQCGAIGGHRLRHLGNLACNVCMQLPLKNHAQCTMYRYLKIILHCALCLIAHDCFHRVHQHEILSLITNTIPCCSSRIIIVFQWSQPPHSTYVDNRDGESWSPLTTVTCPC